MGAQPMLTLMLMYTISGGLLTALSIPLILRKIGPNSWYGFRVKKTLTDPAIWYPTNAYAGKRLFVVGLAGSLIAVVLYFYRTWKSALTPCRKFANEGG